MERCHLNPSSLVKGKEIRATHTAQVKDSLAPFTGVWMGQPGAKDSGLMGINPDESG